MSQLEEYLKLQKTAITELQGKIQAFERDSKARKNVQYYERRIIRLEDWYESFKYRHREIMKLQPPSNQPYVEDNTFDSTKNLYIIHRNRLREELKAIAGPNYDDEIEETSNAQSYNDESTIHDTTVSPQIEANAILKMLLEDVHQTITSINEMSKAEGAGNAKAQLDLLKEAWSTFKSKYYEEKTKDATIEFDIANQQKAYVKAMGKLNDIINPRESTSKRSSNIELPKIKLPEFSGKVTEWRQYVELFDKIIHNNDAINDSIKMQYLKTSIKGEAAKLVAHIAPTADNYKMCKEILEKRYNNKRELAGKLIDSILNLPKMKYESSEELRKLHDIANESLLAIKNLGIDTDNWDPLVIHILSQKLSKDTIRHYECQLNDNRELQTLQAFLTYLESRFLAIQSSESKSNYNANVNDFNNEAMKEKTQKCQLCNEVHYLNKCPKFLQKDVQERNSFVKSKRLCINCFGSHKVADCKSKFSCKTCKKKHHTLLHYDNVKVNVAKVECNELHSEKAIEVSANISAIRNPIILATAIVAVENSFGEKIALRILIDQGSQSSFISEAAMQLLKLPRMKKSFKILGIGEESLFSNSYAKVTIFPRFSSEFTLSTEAIVLRKLTKITKNACATSTFDHIKHLLLADPSFAENGPIDMIIGANEYAQIIKTGLIKGEKNEPIAQNSELGWIVSGPTSAAINQDQSTVTTLVSTAEIDESLNKFFQCETFQEEEMPQNEEELYCEKHYIEHVDRDDDGRYIVRIPFKNGILKPILGNSRKCALASLFALEKRFKNNHQLAIDYKKFIDEYIDLNHMEEAIYDPNELAYYLPHHCVLRDSTTTKLRVVFNASQKTDNGSSLNDHLAIGALSQGDMLNTILKFRLFSVAFTADVEKMYRQILVPQDQTTFQRILWRENPNEKIRDFKLKTITYGTANAPYLAIRTLKKLADDVSEKYPIASDLIHNSMYVDDLIAGAHSEDEAVLAYSQLRDAFGSAKMNLRKWCSTSDKLLKLIPEKDRELKADHERVKALGISWSPQTDEFTFVLSHGKGDCKPITKRSLLSAIASLYDPLGWISPIVIKAKHLMQLLWKEKINWDEIPPAKLIDEWTKIRDELHLLNNLTISRWVNYNPNDTFELHGFSDASEIAFAAVLYLKNVSKNTVHLLIAKTRVAPLKHTKNELTIPRLELCGATLLAKLAKKTIKALKLNLSVFLWCDSKITIDWIKGNPKRYKTFIAKRICQIDQLTGTDAWHHVRGENNPADCASRGIFPSQLINHEMWWRGPQFLYERDHTLIITNVAISTENNSIIESLALNAQFECNDFPNVLPKVSSFLRMRRIIAYCLRFRARNKVGPLGANELSEAERAIVKSVQIEAFNEKYFKNILNLSPFFDENHLIRVGGRLKNAEIPYNAKHQILLPKNNFVTSLIIKEFHERCYHGGPRATEALLRQQYWVVNSQPEIKKVISKCIICFKAKPATMNQIMADLPPARVNFGLKPFTNIALDFSGAIIYKLSKTRASKTAKAYIAIFVCMATKAIHVELVSDLTADSFVASFRRFVARRGAVAEIFSDNGTNFVAANKNLINLSEREVEEYETIILNEFSKAGVKWNFSPPAAPHFNGLAEAAVKTIKHHLIKTIGKTLLTFEELSTVLYQVEACANSRPLCKLSNDPNDTSVLTPGHFLVGAPLLALPDENVMELNTNWLSRWQLVQKLTQQLWTQFKLEYLNQLQTKTKWLKTQDEPRPEDLVLMVDEKSPSCQWPMARVIETHPSADGRTRHVTLQVRDKVIERPITKIARLPSCNKEHREQVLAAMAQVRQAPRRNRLNIIPIVTIFLAFVSTLSTPVATQRPFEVTEFHSTPGIYFEQLSTARMSFTSWRTIVFIDMESFNRDKLTIETNFQNIQRVCNDQLRENANPCHNMCSLLRRRIDQITEKTSILLSAKNRRHRRAVFDFAGDIAHILFGVLGPQFEKEYFKDIHKLLQNDEHLMLLLKNQTSILDSTINLLKTDQDMIERQTKHINDLTMLVKTGIEVNEASLLFESASSYLIQILNEHEDQLDAAIEVILDAKQNNINLKLITPSQLNAQTKLIVDEIPNHLSIPEIDDLYRIIKIEPFQTESTLFFRLTIPLVNPEKFQIFKMTPVPFQLEREQFSEVSTDHEFIIVSINRDVYQFITKDELTKCSKLSTKKLLCFEPKHWFTNREISCEWSLLTHELHPSQEICKFNELQNQYWFRPLVETNKWLFSVPENTPATAICDDTVSHALINSSGILELNPKCSVSCQTHRLQAQLVMENLHNEFIFPRLSMNYSLKAGKQIKFDELKFFKSKFENITKQLAVVKEASTLPNAMNDHDIHHYIATYALLIIVIILAIIVLYKRSRVETNEPNCILASTGEIEIETSRPIALPRSMPILPIDYAPTPAPRQTAISMPDLNASLALVRGNVQ